MLASKQKRLTVNKGVRGSFQVFYFAIILTFIYCFLLPSTSYSDKVRSRSALVIDVSTGRILYSKNPNLKLPPASTVKLMTAIITIENTKLTEVVKVSKYASRVAPSKAGLKAGDRMTIETLLYAALMRSGNDAAVALAEAVAGSEKRFVRLMNSKALAMGVRNTKFKNSHGLPAAGQYTTASDLSKIMNYALKYSELREIIGTRIKELMTRNGHVLFLKNTNKLLWSEDYLIGGKTGYTRKAKHCLVCAAERGDNKVIVVVLGSPNRKTLWRESEKLIHEGFEMMINGKDTVIYSQKSNDKTSEKEKVSHNNKTKYWVNISKTDSVKKIEGKKIARDKKPKIERKDIKTVEKSKDKREKKYKIAEKIKIDDKG